MMRKDILSGIRGYRLPLSIVMVSIIVQLTVLSSAVVFDDIDGYETRLVATGSMDHDVREGIVKTDIESIPVDSLVLIRHISQDEIYDLRIGDVIAFSGNKGPVIHRIIGMDAENRKVITQGDANYSYETVDFGDVTGIVTGVNTGIGKAAGFVRNNILNIIVTALLLVLISECIGSISTALNELKSGKIPSKTAGDTVRFRVENVYNPSERTDGR